MTNYSEHFKKEFVKLFYLTDKQYHWRLLVFNSKNSKHFPIPNEKKVSNITKMTFRNSVYIHFGRNLSLKFFGITLSIGAPILKISSQQIKNSWSYFSLSRTSLYLFCCVIMFYKIEIFFYISRFFIILFCVENGNELFQIKKCNGRRLSLTWKVN